MGRMLMILCLLPKQGVKEEDCEAELASETGVGRQMEAAIAAHEVGYRRHKHTLEYNLHGLF